MKLFESAKFSRMAPILFHQLKLFDSAKFSKLAPALSWQLAPLGIPTGSCLHLPDCRQLPRHYSHFAATQCYCAQYFFLHCTVFLRYNVLHFYVTVRSILLDRLLCALRGCASIMACFVLVHNVIVAAAEAGWCEYVELYLQSIHDVFVFVFWPQDVLWLSHFNEKGKGLKGPRLVCGINLFSEDPIIKLLGKTH